VLDWHLCTQPEGNHKNPKSGSPVSPLGSNMHPGIPDIKHMCYNTLDRNLRWKWMYGILWKYGDQQWKV